MSKPMLNRGHICMFPTQGVLAAPARRSQCRHRLSSQSSPAAFIFTLGSGYMVHVGTMVQISYTSTGLLWWSGTRFCLVDLDLRSSPGWWAATVATYCPSRMMEHPKSKSTAPCARPPGSRCRGSKVRI